MKLYTAIAIYRDQNGNTGAMKYRKISRKGMNKFIQWLLSAHNKKFICVNWYESQTKEFCFKTVLHE